MAAESSQVCRLRTSENALCPSLMSKLEFCRKLPTSWGVAVFLLSTLPACASAPASLGDPSNSTRSLADPLGHCVRGVIGVESPYRQPLDEPLKEPDLLVWLEDVPPEVRRTMQAAGIERRIAELLREQSRLDEGRPTLEFLHGKQQLHQQLNSLQSQLNAAVFEADCTGDELESLLLQIEGRERDTELRWTLASIALGALSGIAAGAWELADSSSRGPAIVGITGGAASAGLSAFALFPASEKVRLEHPRNLLEPIRSGQDPDHLYPTFVWRMLSLPRGQDGAPPRERILARWEELFASVPAKERATLELLFFGKGGVYDRDSIELRERLFDVLESELEAIFRDLEVLNRYLTRILVE